MVRSLRACLTVLAIRGRKARNPWASNCISVPTSRRGSEWTTYQRSASFNTNASRPRRHGSLSSEAGPPIAIQKPCCDTTSPLVRCRPRLLFWGQSLRLPLAQFAFCRTPARRCGALLLHAVNNCLFSRGQQQSGKTAAKVQFGLTKTGGKIPPAPPPELNPPPAPPSPFSAHN